MINALRFFAAAGACLACGSLFAQPYVSASSGPLTVESIYTSEGSSSPYIYFVEAFNAACYAGRSAYLFNIVSPGSVQNRNFLMATILTAKAGGKRVIISYFHGGPVNAWNACYISGVTLVD